MSLCLVVGLGIGALLTTKFMQAGSEKNFVDYYTARNFKNYEMISSLGVSEANLEKVRKVEGVTAAEGVIQADGSISFGDQKRNVTALSMTREVSVPELKDGNIPSTKSECMIGDDVAEVEGIKIGDKIKISLMGLDALSDEPPLYSKEFTVTGLMGHPDYIRRKADYIVVLPLEAFNKETFDGLYTRAFIRTEDPEGVSMFSDAYFEETQGFSNSLESLATELGDDRTKELKDEANAKIDREWKSAEEQLQAAENEIATGEATLETKLAEGRAELESAQSKLDKNVAKGKKEIKSGKAELKKAKAAKKKVDDDLPKIKKMNEEERRKYAPVLLKDLAKITDVDKNSKEYKELVKAYEKEKKAAAGTTSDTDIYIFLYESNEKQIAKEIAKKEKEIKAAEKKLANEQSRYQKQIDDGWATYYSEKASYEAELQEAKATLAEKRKEAEDKIKEAREEVDKIEPCRWILLDRRANGGYVDANSNIRAVGSAGNVFGALFIIVTAIVCLSTLIIIIDEQKKLVGTTKAFGFFKREILGKYLVFGAAASVIGAILAVIGAYLISTMILTAQGKSGMYQGDAPHSVVTPGISIVSMLLIWSVTMIASVAACSGILRSPASMLMKGTILKRKQKKKKEASGGGSLYSRLIMRNMMEDKARVMVTIGIIAACCILMGLSISMKLSFNGMIDKQIGDINRYDFIVTLNDEVTDEQSAKIASTLESNQAAYLPATSKGMLYNWGGKIDILQIVCADPERLGDFYAVVDPKTKEPVELPADGVIIQKRMNESYDMNIGDKLPLLEGTLKENEAEIKGVFLNYVGRAVVASPEAYKKIFGKDHEVNAYYVKLEGADEEKVKSDLLAVTDELVFSDKDEFKKKFETVTGLYNIIVLLMAAIAVVISFMILTNLSNIFLNRRKTELSVMRVNGFSVKQAKGYLTRETVFTTAAGLLLGLGLGALITPPVLASLQQPDLEFVKSFHPVAWIVALSLELIFAVIINSIVFRKVKNLNLRDIA